MQHFSIRDVENLCDIKAHTLRIWEQRYGLPLAHRSDSNRRFFDGEDVRRLLQIAYLYHHGWKASRLAALSETAMEDEVYALKKARSQPPSAIIRLTQATLEYDEPALTEAFESIVHEHGIEKAMLEYVYPFLKRIGLLWLTRRLLPAQEHFCTFIILQRLFVATEALPLHPTGQRIIIFTPEGENHELSLAFFGYIFRWHGWHTLYLGTSVPLDHLQSIAEKESPATLFTHTLTHFNKLPLPEYLEGLRQRLPKWRIAVSGRVIAGLDKPPKGVTALMDDHAIRRFLQQK